MALHLLNDNGYERGNRVQHSKTLPAQQGDTEPNREGLMFNQDLFHKSKLFPRTNSFVSEICDLHVTNSHCHFDMEKNFRWH